MIDRIQCASIILTFLTIGFLISGILLITFSNTIIKTAVKKECQLKQGTMVYKLWKDLPVPFYISIYVFDLVNGDQFLNGEKPHLIQRGPFVYKEKRTKEDVKFYPNGTISYRETRNYTFDRSLSSDDETLKINTVNVVYMTLTNYLQTKNLTAFVRKIIGKLLSFVEKPLMERTVKEYLWGYQDPILSILKTRLPQLVADDHISVFSSAVNEAQYETFLINDGVGFDKNHNERIEKLGQIERFNFSANLTIWSNKYANMINGTDSTIWHPDVSQNEIIYSFMNDICRSVYLKFNQTNKNLFNINTLKFTLPNDIFANSSDNQGFCLNSTNNNPTQQVKCLPDGLFSLTPCIRLNGNSLSIPLPIIASNPHFLDADQLVKNSIDGLNPNENFHRSFMEIEPITGIITNGSRRMQFNINVINDSTIKEISRLNSVVYPMIWVNEHGEIDKQNANLFHNKLYQPLTILNVFKYFFLLIGIVLLLIVVAISIYIRFQKTQPITTNDETTPLLV